MKVLSKDRETFNLQLYHINCFSSLKSKQSLISLKMAWYEWLILELVIFELQLHRFEKQDDLDITGKYVVECFKTTSQHACGETQKDTKILLKVANLCIEIFLEGYGNNIEPSNSAEVSYFSLSTIYYT